MAVVVVINRLNNNNNNNNNMLLQLYTNYTSEREYLYYPNINYCISCHNCENLTDEKHYPFLKSISDEDETKIKISIKKINTIKIPIGIYLTILEFNSIILIFNIITINKKSTITAPIYTIKNKNAKNSQFKINKRIDILKKVIY